MMQDALRTPYRDEPYGAAATLAKVQSTFRDIDRSRLRIKYPDRLGTWSFLQFSPQL